MGSLAGMTGCLVMADRPFGMESAGGMAGAGAGQAGGGPSHGCAVEAQEEDCPDHQAGG
jgi:hypothetical protein